MAATSETLEKLQQRIEHKPPESAEEWTEAQRKFGEAIRLLELAIPLARWSAISQHLIQRIYGSMILATDDPEAARAMVQEAQE